MIIVGATRGVGENAFAEWTGAEKQRSHHLILWSKNHEYSALTWKDHLTTKV